MIRNLKVLGLALIAVFAMTAVAASTASAAEEEVTLTPAEYPALLTGTNDPSEVHPNHTFTTSGGAKVECKSILFTGTIAAKGVGDTNVTITPDYSECTALGMGATVNMTGCDYVFHHGETSGTTFINGTVDLKCPTGTTGPDVTIYKDKAHTEELCRLTVWNFVNKPANTYTNIAGSPNDVTVVTTAKEINVTRTGSLLCGAAAQTAVYTGATTLRAYKDETGNKEGAQIGLTVSHK